MNIAQHVVAKRAKLSTLAKQMVTQVKCPTCNRRLFDGFFVGFAEIICPRCHDRIVVTIQAELPALTEGGEESDVSRSTVMETARDVSNGAVLTTVPA